METVIRFHPISAESEFRFVHGQNVGAHTFPSHAHRSFSLGLVEKGQRTIQINGEMFQISGGEGFILNPRQAHGCNIVGAEGHDYWVISIQPGKMQALFTEATGNAGFPYFPEIKLIDVEFLNGLVAWLASPQPDKRGLDCLLCKLLAHYAEESTPTTPPCADILVTTIEQLETLPTGTISLEELAETAHLSPFYLNRVFRQTAGVPPHTYLLQSRIKKSLEILLKTGSIAASAQFLGFADQSHFTRLFKREVGITPGRFLDIHDKKTRE